MPLNHTDRATLSGLYLAKYDLDGLSKLGCTGFQQAFNLLGYSLQASPAAIKNYRDEFDHTLRERDPQHPRTGWNRPLKTRSKRLFDQFYTLSFDDFTELVKGFLLPHYEIEKMISHALPTTFNQNVAQRLMTGQVAEAYFRFHSMQITEFSDYRVEDVTICGCGYDFYLHKNSNYICVEVKGLGGNTGTIMMTDKEYSVANQVQEKYCLFVVRNFQKMPTHSIFFNPIQNGLKFSPHSQLTTSYCAYV